jgi:hypothetical protein
MYIITTKLWGSQDKSRDLNLAVPVMDIFGLVPQQFVALVGTTLPALFLVCYYRVQ